MTDEELLEQHFKAYRRKGQSYSEDWVSDYFNRRPYSGMDIEYSNETDSGNFSCGDEAEIIYSQPVGNLTIYWVQTSTGGPSGPFRVINEAIEALGYSPRTLKRRKGWKTYH